MGGAVRAMGLGLADQNPEAADLFTDDLSHVLDRFRVSGVRNCNGDTIVVETLHRMHEPLRDRVSNNGSHALVQQGPSIASMGCPHRSRQDVLVSGQPPDFGQSPVCSSHRRRRRQNRLETATVSRDGSPLYGRSYRYCSSPSQTMVPLRGTFVSLFRLRNPLTLSLPVSDRRMSSSESKLLPSPPPITPMDALSQAILR